MQLSQNAEAHWTRVLLADQIHLILFLVIDLHNHFLLNHGFDELPRLDFLCVREKLILKVVIDIPLDQNVVTVFLQYRSVLQDDEVFEGQLTESYDHGSPKISSVSGSRYFLWTLMNVGRM